MLLHQVLVQTSHREMQCGSSVEAPAEGGPMATYRYVAHMDSRVEGHSVFC